MIVIQNLKSNLLHKPNKSKGTYSTYKILFNNKQQQNKQILKQIFNEYTDKYSHCLNNSNLILLS